MIQDTIHEYVRQLAEEAQAQIQVKAADIEAVEYPCTEDDYVKLAVEATLMEDPIEALNSVLEAHAWVMAREYAKLQPDYDVFNIDAGLKLWDRAISIVKQNQNKKLIGMIIGETNGKSQETC